MYNYPAHQFSICRVLLWQAPALVPPAPFRGRHHTSAARGAQLLHKEEMRAEVSPLLRPTACWIIHEAVTCSINATIIRKSRLNDDRSMRQKPAICVFFFYPLNWRSLLRPLNAKSSIFLRLILDKLFKPQSGRGEKKAIICNYLPVGAPVAQILLMLESDPGPIRQRYDGCCMIWQQRANRRITCHMNCVIWDTCWAPCESNLRSAMLTCICASLYLHNTSWLPDCLLSVGHHLKLFWFLWTSGSSINAGGWWLEQDFLPLRNPTGLFIIHVLIGRHLRHQ